LNELVPHWRKLSIHESSPCDRGISAKLKKDAEHYVASQFFAGEPFGQMIRGFRNEDLQSMTFKDNCFDIFISLDVMEHVPSPDQAIREIWRHLKPGGLMLSTWPVRKSQTKDMEMRAVFNSDGTVTHLKNPEYHGNPVNAEGSLVTVDYGYDVHQMIAQCAPFDVRVYRFCDKTHGIIGEYTEVFACRKNLA
jgi:SAM-dependent methyltransferase